MLDLKKTFDTVDSEILTKTLQWFGINNMPLSWFENYLTDKKETVQFKSEHSELSLCSDWLTQNKLHLNVSNTKCMLFGTSQRLSSTKDLDNFEIKVCDEVVERVQVFKYSGVNIDKLAQPRRKNCRKDM